MTVSNTLTLIKKSPSAILSPTKQAENEGDWGFTEQSS